jgi:hypothetical protein
MCRIQPAMGGRMTMGGDLQASALIRCLRAGHGSNYGS